MKILLLGAAGFIGTNLTIELAKKTEDEITLVDRSKAFFKPIVSMDLKNVHILEADLTVDMDFDSILKDQEVVYHLVSTTVPTTSNQHISQELVSNVIFSANLFEACIRCGVKKVVFVSSGGTVYGKEVDCPLKEKTATNPISSYGVQKITIEKLLYLYRYMYGLDYRIIRLANPYGPYQRPNGVLGAVTTFTYKALKGDEITVYGDGSVVRDFIYIDDAIRAIMKIVNGENKHRTFNLGCGYGTSIKQVLETIEKALGIKLNVSYLEGRKVDVPVNYLDISRYEKYYGALNPISLEDGIRKTADFMKKEYGIFKRKHIFISTLVMIASFALYNQMFKAVSFLQIGKRDYTEFYSSSGEAINKISLYFVFVYVLIFAIGTLSLVYYNKKMENQSSGLAVTDESGFSNSFLLYMVLILAVCRITGLKINIMARMTYYFMPFVYVLLPRSINCFQNINNKKIVKLTMYFFMTAAFIWLTYSSAASMYGTVPYQFFWEK